jgi:hypothetical protein
MTPQTTQEQQGNELEAVRQAALDYAQGWYEGDVERMRRSLHPELAKRALLRDPQTGEERFSHLGQQQMVDKTAHGGGSEAIGTVATDEAERAVVEKGGLSRFRRAVETPLNRVFEARI